ncbi:Hypothetical protein CINCED_3A016789 [Cinara cedri]|uniref:Uncharacterized protein n=1 Tax=Cinara cedri TaxID=506608 RepID=A0A5E4N3K9_9HEMI|nr:Hypothetical protein CINCED_3A016789 [Cinara cedri]
MHKSGLRKNALSEIVAMAPKAIGTFYRGTIIRHPYWPQTTVRWRLRDFNIFQH